MAAIPRDSTSNTARHSNMIPLSKEIGLYIKLYIKFIYIIQKLLDNLEF